MAAERAALGEQRVQLHDAGIDREGVLALERHLDPLEAERVVDQERGAAQQVAAPRQVAQQVDAAQDVAVAAVSQVCGPSGPASSTRVARAGSTPPLGRSSTATSTVEPSTRPLGSARRSSIGRTASRTQIAAKAQARASPMAIGTASRIPKLPEQVQRHRGEEHQPAAGREERHTGIGVCSSASATASAPVCPAERAWGASSRRCASTGSATRFTSSGTT